MTPARLTPLALALVSLLINAISDEAPTGGERATRVMPMGLSQEPLIDQQWNLAPREQEPGSANFATAWQRRTDASSVIIAVLDTGILAHHNDLPPTTLPGYDFISDPRSANDGDGRDPSPIDPGDWLDQQDLASGQFSADCTERPSSWHGSIVSGLINANAHNQYGISGALWQAQLLPVRVMGKCGGQMHDVLDAILWAAGIRVAGVPDNPYPADIINLSFAADGACTEKAQQVINQATQAGALIVAAAGNGGSDLRGDDLDKAPVTPATCDNVLSVSALERSGQTSHYGNYGSGIELYAPGGDFERMGVLATSNAGKTTATSESLIVSFSGTSAATPHVSAAAALIKAQNPEFGPFELRQRLLLSAHPMTSARCTSSSCYGKLLDAAASLEPQTLSRPQTSQPETPLNRLPFADNPSDSEPEQGGAGQISLSLLGLLLGFRPSRHPNGSYARQPRACLLYPSRCV